jgi:hypothetical protein
MASVEAMLRAWSGTFLGMYIPFARTFSSSSYCCRNRKALFNIRVLGYEFYKNEKAG